MILLIILLYLIIAIVLYKSLRKTFSGNNWSEVFFCFILSVSLVGGLAFIFARYLGNTKPPKWL